PTKQHSGGGDSIPAPGWASASTTRTSSLTGCWRSWLRLSKVNLLLFGEPICTYRTATNVLCEPLTAHNSGRKRGEKSVEERLAGIQQTLRILEVPKLPQSLQTLGAELSLRLGGEEQAGGVAAAAYLLSEAYQARGEIEVLRRREGP